MGAPDRTPLPGLRGFFAALQRPGTLALVLALFIGCLTPAGAQPPAQPPQRHPGLELARSLGKMDEATLSRLSARLAGQEQVRLIVQLAAHDRPFASLTGRKARSAEARKRRSEQILALQDELLADLGPTRFTKTTRFKHVPFIALTVPARAVAHVARSPKVVRILEDALWQPLLADSVPQIGADLAWSEGHTGVGQVVAVMDTGLDTSHPAFRGRVVSEACFSTTDALEQSASLCPDGVNPAGEDTQVGPGAAAPCTDMLGCDHGTHVAGIAAGDDELYAGVAPGSRLMAIQVFSRLNGLLACGFAPPCLSSYTSDLIRGLEHVYGLRDSVDISAVNMSLGGEAYTTAAACDAAYPALKAAIDNLVAADIPVVVASGNSYETNAIAAPACISSAYSVGAVDIGDYVTDFSNGASFLDSLAPGFFIIAPVPGGYDAKSGTSMAAPHVAGAVSVLRSAAPDATAGEVLSALSATGVPVEDWRNGNVTPRVQVDAALALLTAGSLDGAAMGLEPFLSGLARPVWMTPAGDGSGRLFVALEGGQVRVHDATGLTATPLLDVSAALGAGGRLLGLAADPAHGANGRVFVSYLRDGSTLVVERHTVVGNPAQADPASSQVVLSLTMPPGGNASAHAGGHLTFGPDGYLYVAVGDGAQDGTPTSTAGDLDTLWGKLLRLDVSGNGAYTVPPDNPFVGVPGAAPEIWASGLRDPFRIAFDPATGDLFVTDRGEDAFEEVNLQPVGGGGEDYGWSVMQGTECFSDPACDTLGLTVPVTGYDHTRGCAITGGDVLRGPQADGLDGSYLYGDRCSGDVRVLRRAADGDWQERVLMNSGLVLESFARDEAGNLYVIDSGAGTIHRLVNSDLAITTARLVQGERDEPYAFDLAASGGTPPYEWSLAAGSLPPGLTLDQTGTISGTSATASSDAITVRVQDATRARQERQFQLTVIPPPLTVASAVLAEGRMGETYVGGLAATGGTPPYQWSVIGGGLPTGLTLTADGTLSGTPADEGVFQFTAQVADAESSTATRDVSLRLFGPLVTLAVGTADNNGYGHQFGSDQHTLGLDLAFVSTGGPLALHVNAFDIDADDEVSVHLNGALVGTLSAGPNEGMNAGDSFLLPQELLVDGTNELRLLQATPGFIWGVQGVLVSPELSRVAMATPTPGDVTVDVAFSQQLEASGGLGPYQWTVIGGELPPGLNLSSSGLLSGTPTVQGAYAFTVQLGDAQGMLASATLSMRVVGLTGEIEQALTPGVPDAGAYGWGYGSNEHELTLVVTWQGTGGDLALYVTGYDIDWSDEVAVELNGVLIDHLSKGPNNALNAGDVIYIPAASQLEGRNEIVFRQREPGWVWGVTALRLEEEFVPLEVSTTTLADATEGQAYSASLQASGAAPHTWSLAAGVLPAGLTLDGDGHLHGVPGGQGAYTFDVQVTDSRGATGSATVSLRVVGLSGQLEVELVPGTPDGGDYGWGYGSNENELSLVVTWQATGTDLALAVTGYDIDWGDEIAVEFNGTPIGHLSPGPNNGLNGGDVFHIAAASQVPGRNAITFRQRVKGWVWGVTALSLQEQALPLQVATTALPDATHEMAYGQSLVASGGVGTPSWSVIAGTLPPGITLSAAGLVSGSPGSQGEYPFTVQVSDEAGDTATAELTLRVVGMSGEIEVVLTPGTADTGAYGHNYGSGDNELSLVATWEGTGADATLHVRGYDIDAADEVSVELNGVLIGHLRTGADNRLNAGDAFPIPAGSQLPGRNEVVFRQSVPGWTWGVTGLLLSNASSPLSIITTGLTDVPEGAIMSEALEASGGVAPYAWSVIDGALPPGMMLSSDGLLTGMPTQQGAYTFTVQVADEEGLTDSVVLTLQVVGPGGTVEVSLTPGVTDPGAYGYKYGSGIHQTELMVVWLDTGSDVSLKVIGYDIDWGDEIAVELNGTPMGYLSAGPDNQHNAGDTFLIPAHSQLPGRNEVVFRQRVSGWKWGVTGLLLDDRPLITTTSLADAAAGEAYLIELEAGVGVAPYSWSIAAGTLPPGLDLGEDGLLSGTPTVQGAYTFTVAATDARGVTGSQELTLWVVGPSGGVEVELTPGVPDGGAYGHGYGTDSHETELVVTWQDTGADVSLEVTGYDIDWNDEVAVELNGVRIGYLRAGANNAHTAVNVFQIPAASQLPGRNEIVFRQRVAGWLWGVTGLLLSP